ncbi:MAG: glucokinase [Betaproteobacteria bacterium]|nr:MAG: glucokinase [Betaproteobacteria bacterium]
MSEVKTSLVADIGGTNVRFALVPIGTTDTQHEQILHCQDFDGPVEAVRHYLASLGNPQIGVAAFDVATAVTGDVISLTNGPWSFSINATRDALGLDRLHVINDFTALALAVPILEETEVRKVGGGTPVPETAIGVLGAGTGLGVSGLLWHAGRWLAVQGEGGHVAFSPVTEREDAILKLFRRDYGSHISVERFLSGMGLTNIYQALCELDGAQPLQLEPAQITEGALVGSDERACETVDIFCAALGTTASNVAITLGARSGVYIGGGIVPKLGDYFDRSAFRERFEDKGRFSDYLSAIPTYLIVAETPALRGLATLLGQAD